MARNYFEWLVCRVSKRISRSLVFREFALYVSVACSYSASKNRRLLRHLVVAFGCCVTWLESRLGRAPERVVVIIWLLVRVGKGMSRF